MTGHTSDGDDADLVSIQHPDVTQAGLLALLVDAHPAQRSVEEVIREMTDYPERPASRDAIDNAIRDLARAGLVHRHGAFVFATHAAVRGDELRI
jgi:hypothetical protein